MTPEVDSLKCCFLSEGSGPAQWPDVSRLVEAICLALCNLYPAGQTIAGVKVNRWAAILRDYRLFGEAVLNSPGLMAGSRLQVYELNQQTLSQWHNARKRAQEREILKQRVTPFSATETLPPELQKYPGAWAPGTPV